MHVNMIVDVVIRFIHESEWAFVLTILIRNTDVILINMRFDVHHCEDKFKGTVWWKPRGGWNWYQSNRQDNLSCRQVSFAVLNAHHHERSINYFQQNIWRHPNLWVSKHWSVPFFAPTVKLNSIGVPEMFRYYRRRTYAVQLYRQRACTKHIYTVGAPTL